MTVTATVPQSNRCRQAVHLVRGEPCLAAGPPFDSSLNCFVLIHSNRPSWLFWFLLLQEAVGVAGRCWHLLFFSTAEHCRAFQKALQAVQPVWKVQMLCSSLDITVWGEKRTPALQPIIKPQSGVVVWPDSRWFKAAVIAAAAKAALQGRLPCSALLCCWLLCVAVCAAWLALATICVLWVW